MAQTLEELAGSMGLRPWLRSMTMTAESAAIRVR